MAYSGTIPAVLVAVLVFLLYQYISYGPKPPKGTRLPRGPPGKPLLGNLRDIPANHFFKFKEWADIYGPLFRLTFAGREHYVVSTEKIANDLLRERGTIYSSREQRPALVQLLSGNLRPLFWPYGETFRAGRKLMHQLCMPAAATRYQPTQILESTRLLYDLTRNPEKYEDWFRRYSSGVIFRLGFGKVMADDNDPLLTRLFNMLHHLERVARPGSYLVDTFPSLMLLPKAVSPFKQELATLHAEELDLMRGLLEDTEKEMRNGKAPDCWEKTYLEHHSEYSLTEDEGAYVVGTLFEAGAHTTAMAMTGWVLAMVHYPGWLKKLQAQIDEVVGSERLPEFDDIPQLPLVRAVVKETLRWRPVIAGGIPHQSTKDDIYNGLFIPAGTILHPNQWAIHREEALYPDPETFNPDRWLKPEYPTYREPLTTYPNIRDFSAFGFGRRICPGQHIAERSLNILVARTAWACDIGKKFVAGREMEVPLFDAVSRPNTKSSQFPFTLKARSEEKRVLVERAMRDAFANDPLAKH